MANDPEVHQVTIRRDPKNPRGCIVEPPPFRAKRGATVTFVAIGLPPIAITFRDRSPFANNPVPAGSHQVVNGPGAFAFDVTWNEPDGPGNGNGTGDVPPG